VPTADTTNAAPIANPARFARRDGIDCTFELPEDAEPDCFRVTVPEDWPAAAAGEEVDTEVHLEVAVFPAQTDEGNAPIVYLEGGPGGHALSALAFQWPDFFEALNARHDLIVWDQRGAGSSVPMLSCPRLSEAFSNASAAADPFDQEAADQLEAVVSCRDRLVGQGIDINQYNTTNNATDLDAIRELLGYDQWNVLGISYGTRLGQTAMRLYPDGIRAIALDGIVPNAADPTATFAQNAEASFTTMFSGCAADAACSGAHPNFEQDFFALVDRWNRDPVSFSTPDYSSSDPFSGPQLDFEFTGDDLLSLTFSALYSPDQFVSIPDLVDEANDNTVDSLSTLAALNAFGQNFFSVGMYLSVSCADEIPFADRAAARPPDLDPRYEYFVREFNGEFFFEVCDAWNVAPAATVENELVESEIPTLLLSGGYDPITPASAADEVAPGLANHASVVLEHEGHGVSTSACGLRLVLGFFAEPSKPLDQRCVNDQMPPDWEPSADGSITLTPFAIEDNLLSVRGVRPAEWADQGFGQFVRSDRINDPAFMLVSNTFDQPAALLVSAIRAQLNLPTRPQPLDDVIARDTTWLVFGYDDPANEVAGRLAISDDLFIVVHGRTTDFPRFETEVLLPVLDRAEPT